MEFPADLKYTKNDEWIRVEGTTGTVGITDFAQDQLSDIVYLEFSVSEGDDIKMGGELGTVESVKAASDIYSPVDGKVAALNEDLLDTPELVNGEPFGGAWMIKIEIGDPSQLDSLMDAAAYQTYTKERDA